jgi:hypothetical protein
MLHEGAAGQLTDLWFEHHPRSQDRLGPVVNARRRLGRSHPLAAPGPSDIVASVLARFSKPLSYAPP